MKFRTFEHNGTTSEELSGREIRNRAVARRAAADGIVLLKNDGLLPLRKGAKIGLFGVGAENTVKGGTGSGDVNSRDNVTIAQGLEDAGFEITDPDYLEDSGVRYTKARKDWNDFIRQDPEHPGKMLDGQELFDHYSQNPFVFPEGRAIAKADLEGESAGASADSGEEDQPASEPVPAVYVISRVAGENADRTLTKGDYDLTEGEKADLKALADLGARIVVLINAGGVIDMTEIMDNPAVGAVLVISQPGQEGGHAVADVLDGDVTPSGKLTATWAQKYEDYPCADTFGKQNGDLVNEYYSEGIFVGYRYFSSFKKKPAFPFGFGLSYTTFAFDGLSVRQIVHPENDRIHLLEIQVTVSNSGSVYAGREVAEVYALLPTGNLQKERERLIGFAKTDVLKPDEEQTLTIYADAKSLASYDPSKSAWILEKGVYGIAVGNSSDALQLAGCAEVKADFVVEQDAPVCPLEENQREKLIEYSPDIADAEAFEKSWTQAAAADRSISHIIFEPTAEILPEYKEDETDRKAKELSEKLPAEDYIRLLYGQSVRQESALGSAAVRVPGAAGETSGAYAETLGIPGVVLADGPAGLRLQMHYEVDQETGKPYPPDYASSITGNTEITRHPHTDLYNQYCTAFPVGTLLAQTWDPDLVEEVGKAVALEMEEFHVSWWLAPGMSLQRNPLCGRNFEYYSEDPLLSGEIAAAMTRGVQSRGGVGTTIKHFAGNNQEDNRMGVNDVVSERALREIYFRGFEIAVKESQPMAVMTSYNKINGVHSANSRDLVTEVLRKEWGFKGLVMTDWTSTFPAGGSDSAACIAVGNDLIMPGFTGDGEKIRAALKDGTLSERAVRECAERIINIILRSSCFEGAKPYSGRF